jgi:hypothetical protein
MAVRLHLTDIDWNTGLSDAMLECTTANSARMAVENP